jgi:hypothetical protein
MVSAARVRLALGNPRLFAGRFLWPSGLCRAFTVTTELYRLRFVPTALSCAIWTDPKSRAGDDHFFRRYLRAGEAARLESDSGENAAEGSCA